MNDPTSKHTPTDEFVDYLARDTMRRLRHEARFGTSIGALHTRPRRLPMTLGIAAGVVMTLATGMVLGASANYASAEVLPNGTTTIPSRPALALLPIKSALTAIGCTQSTQPAVADAPSVSVATTPKPDAALDQVGTPQVRAYPDRATIAAYAKQYQPLVVSGDSTVQYVVMVLDASDNYVWSTHGSGNLSIDVGGDPRTPKERREYDRAHQAEFFGKELPGWSFDFRVENFPTKDSTARAARANGGRLVFRGKDTIDIDLRYDPGFSKGYATAADTVPGVYTNGWSRARHGAHFNQAPGLHENRFGASGIDGLASVNVSAADRFTFLEGEIGPRTIQIMVVHLTPGTTWSGR